MENQMEVLEFTDSLHFRLGRKIADGGMGSVYEATLFGSEGFEKTVAVKTIREKFTGDNDFVELFIGEAKLVADLVHQNIVQIYKLGKWGKTFYIAMEYVNGVNLQQFMNRHLELHARNLQAEQRLADHQVPRARHRKKFGHALESTEENRLPNVHSCGSRLRRCVSMTRWQ